MSALAAAAPSFGALISRAKNEIIRVPGAAIPGILAPTIFYLGLNSVFGNLTDLRGFGSVDYQSFIIPVSMLQGAGFTGAATGVNLARDIESGWFDRLLASPAPRWVILGGMVAAAAVRSLIPATFLLVIAIAIGASFPGIIGLLLAVIGVMAMATAAACWGCSLALKFRSQSAAPLMQAGMFVAVLFTSSYAPLALLEPWLRTVAEINPVTQVLEMTRQGFIGSVSFTETWQGLAVAAALIALLGALALRGMRRMAD